MRADPADYPHIEKTGGGDLPFQDEEWECTMYGGTFDYEAYERAGGCPVCEHIAEAQKGVRGGL